MALCCIQKLGDNLCIQGLDFRLFHSREFAGCGWIIPKIPQFHGLLDGLVKYAMDIADRFGGQGVFCPASFIVLCHFRSRLKSSPAPDTSSHPPLSAPYVSCSFAFFRAFFLHFLLFADMPLQRVKSSVPDISDIPALLFQEPAHGSPFLHLPTKLHRWNEECYPNALHNR